MLKLNEHRHNVCQFATTTTDRVNEICCAYTQDNEQIEKKKTYQISIRMRNMIGVITDQCNIVTNLKYQALAAKNKIKIKK